MTQESDDCNEEERPQKQTLYQSLKRDSHLKCLLLTVLISGCLCVITWCSATQIDRMVVHFQSYPMTTIHKVSPCDEGYVYIPIVFMSMLYIVYLVECWHCSTRFELIYGLNADAVYTHIEQMREAQPIIWWKAVSYHYIRRSRQVTRYRNGDAYTTAQIYYERINTHVTGSCFSYGNCGVKDISKKLMDLELHPITKIRFTKGFAFANIESANEFEGQRSTFFEDNERYDDYLEMREGLDLVGANFQEYIISYGNSARQPWYVSHVAFWLFSLLLLSWPFRVLIEYQTAYVHFQVIKLFGENFVTSCNDLSALSRDTTIDSVEFSNNYTLAPSYSEAVLVTDRFPVRPDTGVNIEHQLSDQFRTDKSMESIITRTSNRLRQSLSRTSLRNGQILYFVSSITQNNENNVIRRLSLINGDTDVTNNDIITDNPPTYEEVLLERHTSQLPLNGMLSLKPLRRSITDRDFFRRLSHHLRRQWNSYIDIQLNFNNETQL
ncbi:transmembrane protein 151B-like [Oppia nitens]|uniref:transmembrane protein 151B-like n=1 Tax=Oppia nitens TaxID=1686743 RepID=UPI0023DA861B|nr:transmembrane protein 151B-like [Oppia nitens]